LSHLFGKFFSVARSARRGDGHPMGITVVIGHYDGRTDRVGQVAIEG